jgi:hypothetical protein
MLSLADLLSADTEEQIFSVLLAFLSMVGFEVDAWQAGSVPRTILRAIARSLADQGKKIPNIAAGGYLDTASLAGSAWVDLLVWSHYQLTRKTADATRGNLVLVDAGGGPHTYLAQQLIFRGPGGLRYRNRVGATLPLNGTLPVEVEAEAPGAKYNVPTGSLFELLTSLPTVSVTAPPGVGGTWLTRAGTDTESDASLVERAKARWPGSGYILSTAPVYKAAALTASGEVVHARVFPHSPSPGQVRVVVAGAAGPVSGPALAAVQAYLDERASVVADVTVVNATLVVVTVQATLYCQAAYAGAALAAALEALAALQATLDLGSTVHRAALIEALMLPTGMVNVVLTTPAADVPIAADQIASLSASLTVQAVG